MAKAIILQLAVCVVAVSEKAEQNSPWSAIYDTVFGNPGLAFDGGEAGVDNGDNFLGVNSPNAFRPRLPELPATETQPAAFDLAARMNKSNDTQKVFTVKLNSELQVSANSSQTSEGTSAASSLAQIRSHSGHFLGGPVNAITDMLAKVESYLAGSPGQEEPPVELVNEQAVSTSQDDEENDNVSKKTGKVITVVLNSELQTDAHVSPRRRAH
mmetsp:Transcript_58853/g.127308  ORF Transcript_58853/g.127308 Transcript_58853/m.127308 type:complete len:213 (-) Transcript_58853:144-782(-)|eukprot:CAMPEP_0170620566 /NCGR_PEP_ID=MMETSP0224-20130122/28127_1 /TAXON_ID=285029 /ORGANISM="Togula jolla, Strain CCCM 725" /LENGTH=212 /DNA_ID=CAMNT_0010946749 /DNA_START=72 /DNA_END=710 /DNA_ORIENTATION=-